MEADKRFEISIDNEVLKPAKMAMDKCMMEALRRAIRFGSMEGSATLKVAFMIENAVDDETGEEYIKPVFDFKSTFSVPIKDSISGKIIEQCRIMPGSDGTMKLFNNQISMDELLEGETA